MTMRKIMEDKIICSDGTQLAYRRLTMHARDDNRSNAPGVVFLGGYMSNMMGTKASFLEAFCEEQGLAFVRFDYYGHGDSDGTMQDATVGRWKTDALCILDNLTEGPQILIGSSLGGWIMLLAALARPDRIKGLIGIAPAVDFVDHLMDMNAEQQADLEKLGRCYVHHKGSGHALPLSQQFVYDARSHGLLPPPVTTPTNTVLNRVIPLKCPIQILHGMQDEEVPWQHSITLMEMLQNDAMLTLIKQGNHSLSRPEDLHTLSHLLMQLVKL